MQDDLAKRTGRVVGAPGMLARVVIGLRKRRAGDGVAVEEIRCDTGRNSLLRVNVSLSDEALYRARKQAQEDRGDPQSRFRAQHAQSQHGPMLGRAS